MVIVSHHWLKAVVLFLSKLSGFFILRRKVFTRSALGSTYCWAHATPSAMSCTSSYGVNIGHGFLGGDCGGNADGSKGGVNGPNGVLEGGPPAPTPCGFLPYGGETEMAGCCNLLVAGGGAGWKGLSRVGWVVGSIGPLEFPSALLLGSQTGLCQG